LQTLLIRGGELRMFMCPSSSAGVPVQPRPLRRPGYSPPLAEESVAAVEVAGQSGAAPETAGPRHATPEPAGSKRAAPEQGLSDRLVKKARVRSKM
jgi:hypothetical protein